MTVRSGAFCAPPGATASTPRGTLMSCDMNTGGRHRWASTGGDPVKRDRRRLIDRAHKEGVGKIKRGTPAEEIELMIKEAQEAKRLAEAEAAPTLSASVCDKEHPELNHSPHDTCPGVGPLAEPDIAARIKQAVQELRIGDRQSYVMLNQVRAALPDISREELDRVLIEINRDPHVNVVPESNQKVLTNDERAGAVSIGNQDKHLIAWMD